MSESKESRSARMKEDYIIKGVAAALDMLRMKKNRRGKVRLERFRAWAGEIERMAADAKRGIRQEGLKTPSSPGGGDAEEES